MCMNPRLIYVKPTLVSSELFGFTPTKREEQLGGKVYLPCGKCDECKVSHSKEWALRSLLEFVSRSKKEQLNCWFVTLTYNDEFLPSDKKLHLEHFSQFIKRVRKYCDNHYSGCKIKYFVCGEYGTKNYRPHYHALIYGLPLRDLTIYKKVGQFDFLWISNMLNKAWRYGFVVVGNLNYKTAYYTCRYTLKKYDNTDIKMSCSNGFARQWCFNNMLSLVKNGYLRFGGRNYSIPKYFLKLIRREYFGYLDKTEFKRYLIDTENDYEINYWNTRQNGLRYAKWLQKRQSDRIRRLNEVASELNTNEYFLDFDKKVARQKYVNLDTMSLYDSKYECSKTESIISENRKIINQSLFSLYKNRNNFV